MLVVLFGSGDSGKAGGESEEAKGGKGGLPNFIRIKVSDRGTGKVSLETRVPAAFLGGLISMVPQVACLFTSY